ncbi:MerR family transcriptional regulator [bacterium]|nr:MerR family transcriptional regulator [bacterium]MBU1065588.1 MerR family transcriptional regulator [bacterium]MBU1634398.1 MerR family transcriptional regulator [bacterium]MBU1874319.1 MerR family transcriptional regulator [bacterium]
MGRSIKKLYYSIGEVSETTGLKQYVLRYWESEFPSLAPSKNRAGNRVYREKDIVLIQYIKHLLYEKKFTIEGAKQKLKSLKPEDLQNFSETGSISDPEQEKITDSQFLEVIHEIKSGLTGILDLLNDWES